jgi:homoaconitate hydratase
VSKTQSLAEATKKQIKIQKAYIVSCVNSRVGDLQKAAEILKGKKVSPEVQLYVSAASSRVQEELEADGTWQVLVDSGAHILLPGCGPCIGLGVGLLEDGEVGISATNRNFKGRMGSVKAEAYLASPATVAASAVAGVITGEGPEFDGRDAGRLVRKQEATVLPTGKTPMLDNFPSSISGRILFCNSDNINTDGIYPGKYTYREDITPTEQAEVVMENYDLNFQQVAQKGDILVGGFNFGTGSSREQAATALKHRGIVLLIAGSFNDTYKVKEAFFVLVLFFLISFSVLL